MTNLLEKAFEEMRPVLPDTVRHPVEGRSRDAIGIVVGLGHEWHDRADQHRMADALLALLGQKARDFSASHRETDQTDRLRDAGIFEHCREIVRERIIVIAVPRLIGSAEAATVGDDATVPGLDQRNRRVIEAVPLSGHPWRRASGCPFPQSL